jgi:hypothetical protein
MITARLAPTPARRSSDRGPRRGARLERGEEQGREPDAHGVFRPEQRDGNPDEAYVRALDRGDVDAVLPAEDVERTPASPANAPAIAIARK